MLTLHLSLECQPLSCLNQSHELVVSTIPFTRSIQLPIDDFDGKPFRYLPDKKIIYSVGPDLKDSDGEARHKGSDDYDLPFKIEF